MHGNHCAISVGISRNEPKQVYTDEYNENIYREYEVERRALTYQIEQLIYPRERKKKRRKKKRGEREKKAVYPVAPPFFLKNWRKKESATIFHRKIRRKPSGTSEKEGNKREGPKLMIWYISA